MLIGVGHRSDRTAMATNHHQWLLEFAENSRKWTRETP